MGIMDLIKEKAKKKLNRIAMIEGEDERVIEAANIALKEKIAKPVLIGEEKKIKDVAKKHNLSLNGIEIIDYKNYNDIDKLAEKLYELRKHKGLTLEKAKEWLKNPNYFGALITKLGLVDGVVGGCKYNTAEYMKPVFQVIGKRKDILLVSGVFMMEHKGRVIILSDGDFNIMPNEEELAQIAINAADFAEGFGFKPKVAMLSHSTKGSGEHPIVERIRKATEIVKQKKPELVIDGELQFDAAYNADAAKRKCPDSPIQGDANVLIFPDIQSANIFAHSMLQITDIPFIGTFAVGLDKIAVNGGRGYGAEKIADCIMYCAMQINMEK